MTNNEISLQAIQEAYNQIATYIKKTRLVRSNSLSEKCGGEVYLKLENTQLTGTFKVRGALNKILGLSEKEKQAGVVAASSGNHAQGVALASQILRVEATIFVPKFVSSFKLEKLRKYNVTIKISEEFNQVEPDARRYAQENEATYVSPYNDYAVMAGQGTIVLELEQEIDQYDSVVVPVGGGGLISGIAAGVKHLHPKCQVHGVVTPGAATLYWSFKAGRLVEVKEFDTLADAFLGGIEENSKTFDIIKKYVDQMHLVQETSVADSIRLMWKVEKQVVEGAGATSVALIMEKPELFKNKHVIAIVSGGNISDDKFREVIETNEN
jgi:threonine dehydratase